MNPFLAGTGVLAAGLSVPVVPVKIEGLFKLKQQRRYFARPREVTVSFGAPLSFADEDEPAYIAGELEKSVAAL